MSAIKAAERFYAEEAVPLERSPREAPPRTVMRKATMERAARCIRDLDNLLGTVTRELVEGDLEIADFSAPKR